MTSSKSSEGEDWIYKRPGYNYIATCLYMTTSAKMIETSDKHDTYIVSWERHGKATLSPPY